MRRLACLWLFPLFWFPLGRVPAAEIPLPSHALGFEVAADFHLASWRTVVDYFEAVDRASDRVVVRELGKTTEGKPYIVAFVSDPATIRDLDQVRDRQALLADPRRIKGNEESRRLVEQSKPVVVITCSIHSTETASTLMAMELLHGLASDDDRATREMLEGAILILVPSANPDGVDKVADWYERSKGHPWEGSGLPYLYHRYAGHDTNRDWYMLNLRETRLLTRLLYKEWFPTILYDVHQMGSRGARLFVPPFHDPINPNLDPKLHQSILLIGAHMAASLASAGKRGVLTNALYDNWWNGGNRTTPQRHNIVGVLTEAASVKMATPIFLTKEELRAGDRGFPNHQPAVNFVDPWPGGWWRLRDIVDYERICARSLLTLAARYRRHFQADRLEMAREAVRKGSAEPPFGWLVPPAQRDPGTAVRLVEILHETGIEVRRATASFRAEGAAYPSGTWILPAAQPHRAHLKDMMERQVYPDRLTAKGTAEPPYDVAGWTLPLLMGVRVVPVAEKFSAESELVDRVEPLRGRLVDDADALSFILHNRSNDDAIVLNELLDAGIPVSLETDHKSPAGWWYRAEAGHRTRQVLSRVLADASSEVVGSKWKDAENVDVKPVRALRIALYQPWVPSMDEGWTRLVLERFHFPYTTVHNAEIRAGDLKGRFDVLVIPSIEPKVLRTGYAPDETEPAYVGGLGDEGADALRSFVQAGGTLICLEDSAGYAIDAFHLPVADALKSLTTGQFYGPGSLVRVVLTPGSELTVGMPEEVSAFFERSLAFDTPSIGAVRIVARYANGNPLESGWLRGPEKLQGKAAIVEVPSGQGRFILFGFPPQYRGQTYATFRLLFNALRVGTAGGAEVKTHSGEGR